MLIITSYLTLCRVWIALFAALSAAVGCLLAASPPYAPLITAVPGVFLIACGASALNQVQERDIDARMARTRRRPLPSGAVTPRAALVTALVLFAAGLLLLTFAGRFPFLLGTFAVLWYNGVYTPLKRRTAFAAVWGAPVGMAAPAIGWTAGGGSIADHRLLALVVIFFLWQVPHFWHLVLRSGNDFERSGLPAVTQRIPPARLAGIAFLWSAAAAVASILLPLFGMIRDPYLYLALVLAGGAQTGAAALAMKRGGSASAPFPVMNAYLLILMALLSADAIRPRPW